MLTVLRLPLIANLIFFWEMSSGSGVEAILRGKAILLCVPLLNVSAAYLWYIHRIKRLEGHTPNVNTTVLI